MKNVIIGTLWIVLFGCKVDSSNRPNPSSTENPVVEEKELEKIVESATKGGRSFDIKYYDNVLDELWIAYLETDDSLNQIIENYTDFLSLSRKEKVKLQEYQNASETYYEFSMQAVKTISDSLAGMPLANDLMASQQSFEEALQAVTSINNDIESTYQRINDEIARLKIEKTLPLIEQYQKQNAIGTEVFKQLQQDLSVILDQLKQN